MNNYLSFQIHGGADHGGGIAEMVATLLTFLEGLMTKEPSEIFSSIFPGIAALDNIHPTLVHFPIAFLPAFFIIDLVGTWAKKSEWRNVASWFLYAGAIATVFTVISGYTAADSVQHSDNVHEIMETLELYGIISLILVFVLSIWRLIKGSAIWGAANVLFLIFSAMLCVVIALGADLGGLLVYKYGIGVEAMPAPEAGGHMHDGEQVPEQDQKQIQIQGHNHEHKHNHNHNHVHTH